jgi:Carboxypeptidase regulatory-like domain
MIEQAKPLSGQGTQKIPKRVRKATMLFAPLLVASSLAFGQLTTADILGTITDATGAVIPNAQVTLTNLGTQEKRTATSNNAGDYTFTLLPVGHYTVMVKANGFKSFSTTDLAVEAGDRARADAHMALGAENQTVTVEASTPLLQADNATVSSTVTAKSVQDLPLNGRNFVQLVSLVPGANEGQGNSLSSGGRPDDRRTNAAGLSVNGQDESLNNWVVDGVDDNERVIGTIGIKPNVEGIQEITVQTNNYAAEVGRTAGGVINIVTRSGTNQFHGSAYEYFRNDIFDARNYFQNTGAKPELRQNQYGGSIGGPIFKDRTFFFFDYEGLRLVQGVTDTGTVPTLAEWNNINSQNGGSPQALLSTTNGTAGMPIDPVALAYLKLFPKPTNGNLSNNFTISPSKTQSSNTYDARVDHKINDNNLFFGRFSYNKVDTVTPPAFGTVNGVQVSGGRYNFDGPATDVAQQYAFGFTHIFTPSLLLDLRAAYTRINNLSLPLNYGTNIDQTMGFPASMTAFSPFANSLTPVNIGPFGDIGDGAFVPLNDIDNSFQYSGALSWTKGNHTIKAGLALLRRQARNVQSASAVGFYQFNLPSDTVTNLNGDPTLQLQQQNNQLASALVGAFNSQTRNFNLDPPDYRSWEPSGFVQDTWKVNPKLTLLLGIRYDIFTPFTEAHNHISNFNFPEALTLTNSTISQALQIAGVNGVNSQLNIATIHSNVAPRLGFSYSVDPTTVVRGGYGLSYFPGNYTSNADMKNAPFTSVFSPACQSDLAFSIEAGLNKTSGQNPACSPQGNPGSLDQGLPAPVAPDVTDITQIKGLSFVAEAPNFRPAMIQQFNLQVEKQYGANVLTVGYVGNLGQHLPESINNINQPAPFNPFTNSNGARRPLDAIFNPTTPANSNLSGVSYIQSEGISNYNALQTSFQRRFTHGLAFDANYTWGKALADISSFSQQGDQGWSNANPNQIRQIEYGKADNDIQNRFAVSANYEEQYGREFTGIKKAVFSGWATNMIMAWQSGKPFSIISSGSGADNPSGDNPALPDQTYGFNNRAVPQNSGGQDRPNQIADPRLGHKTLSKFFNTAAFAPQPLGTVGNTQRNSLFGPDFRHVDLSLFKTFPVTERVNVQFRVESFNISNTPSFYVANNNSSNESFGNAAFGTISATDPNYTPREFQFALKAMF